MRRAAAMVLLAGLILALPGQGQVTKTKPAPAFVPKFEAVAETRLIMEGLAHSNYRSLQKLLKAKPADNDTWVFARGQAILIAETGNLLLLRPPRDSRARDTWMKLGMDLRDKAKALAVAAGARDYARSKQALANLTDSCNRCHATFRVKARVGPEKELGEIDTE